MFKTPAIFALVFTVTYTCCILMAEAQSGAGQFKQFLMLNKVPNGSIPRSFAIQPTDYFKSLPKDEREDKYADNFSVWVQPCGKNISGPAMNNYSWQTEELLTTLGLNIYDGAARCIALGLLDEAQECLNYTMETLVKHKTIQFGDIRGDHQCKGVMEYGKCSDPTQSGVCGFCYGDGPEKTATAQDAYFYRMISDYWAIEGTVDQRCPEKHMLWEWNDYKPVLGENAWAQLTGPLHNAMARYKNDPTKIPDSDACFTLAIPFLTVLGQMKIGNTGAIYYTPRNTWFGFNKVAQNIGSTFSIENQASLLAGMQALYTILKAKGSSSSHYSQLPRVAAIITGLKKILMSAYDPDMGFFRQGGTFNTNTQKVEWIQDGEPNFAVDCQTWVAATLGTKFIDTNFGKGTAYNIWQKTKMYANYTCNFGQLCGVGYTYNNLTGGQVLSGEWTYGAINWVRVMVNDSGYNSTMISNLKTDVMDMQYGLFAEVVTSTPLNNGTTEYNSVKYANKRYYIPFGWYANAIPATASTAWAVFMHSNYNPLNIFGWYTGAVGM